MERVDVILGHIVEYTGSMSRLPILVPECSKGTHLNEEPCPTEEKFDFFRWKTLMKWPEKNLYGTIPAPRPNIFIRLHPPGPPAPCTGMQKPRVWLERLRGSVKQQKESDRVTM